MFIQEPAKALPVSEHCDVLVCGGGIAGVAAALAARRHGADVLLVEREYALGGLATLGLISIYLPLCDGLGRQVSFSIAEELLRLSVQHGIEDVPNNPWLRENSTLEERKQRRFRIQYNPHLFAIDMEQLLLKEGVRILYGTAICDVLEQNGQITHVIVENKNGRNAISLKSIIDATGDADICHRSSAKTVNYSKGNPLAAWYYYTGQQGYRLHEYGISDSTPKEGSNAETIGGAKRYTGLDAQELTDMVCASHACLEEAFLKKGDDSFTHALSTIATIPQIRMTRRLVTPHTLCQEDMHKAFFDSVGMISDWRKAGPVYEIPFRSLYSTDVKNLLAVGRCMGADDDTWDVTRVIPACAVTGQAAGTAAALSSNFPALDLNALQDALQKDGVVLHESELV